MTDADTIVIERATTDDAHDLAVFGERAFRDTFAEANDPANLDAYIATAYGDAHQRAELDDVDTIVLVVRDARSMVGYGVLRRRTTPFSNHPDQIELVRFYVARDRIGTGLGARLFDALLATARDAGARTIWLGVWEHNPRAIAFYRKHGFTRVGEQTFQMGPEAQTDHVMVRPL